MKSLVKVPLSVDDPGEDSGVRFQPHICLHVKSEILPDTSTAIYQLSVGGGIGRYTEWIEKNARRYGYRINIIYHRWLGRSRVMNQEK